MLGRNSPQANQNLFKYLKLHFSFSSKLKKLSDKDEIKDLVKKWVEDFNNLGKVNAVNVSGTFNTLSKVRIFDEKWQEKEGQHNFKSLIVNLAKQGKAIYTEFNSQEIANTLNALSKWDVLNTEIQPGSKEKCKTLIYKLVEKGIQSSTQFNSQDIANTFDALYKFGILDNEKWTEDERNKIKLLIVQLAKKGQEQEVLENFNSQEIANIFNAFSKLNILGDKWTDNEQEELKSLISQLAKRGGNIEGYGLKGIAKIYSALLEWSSGQGDHGEFTSLTYKLEEQVQAIAQKQNEEGNILDNIRFTSQIITGLPNLKSKKLITSDKQLLIDLMQCLGSSIDKSKVSDLKSDFPKKNILSGLEGFVDIVNGLEDKSDLVGKFDQSLIKILNKLSNVQLDSDYVNEIQSKVKDVIKSGVIKKEDSLNNALNKLLPEQNGQLPEIAGNEPQTCLNDLTVNKQLQISL